MKKTDLAETMFDGNQTVLRNARAKGAAYSDPACLEIDDLRFIDNLVFLKNQHKIYKIEVLHSQYGLASDDKPSPIMNSLIEAFRYRDKAMVLSMERWVAVNKSGPFYVLFNSHCVNNSGVIEIFHSAKAFVSKSIEEISKLIIAGANMKSI